MHTYMCMDVWTCVCMCSIVLSITSSPIDNIVLWNYYTWNYDCIV